MVMRYQETLKGRGKQIQDMFCLIPVILILLNGRGGSAIQMFRISIPTGKKKVRGMPMPATSGVKWGMRLPVWTGNPEK